MSWKIALALLTVVAATAAQNSTKAPRVVCYYSSWAVYRTGPGLYTIADIDATLCTHVVYAFIGLSASGETEFLDPWNDVGDEWHQGQLQQLPALKEQNPNLKLLLAIGGYNHGPQNFQTVARDPAKRTVFVNSAFDLLVQYELDGLDIDWEYQDSVGGTEADKVGLSALLSEMRKKFDQNGFELSIATPANLNLVANCYELDKVSEAVDFINVMAYDFHGSWDPVTGHVTPLYCETDSSLCVEAVLNYYINHGADPAKINLGIIVYGRTFTLTDETKNGVGAPASGPGDMGPVVPEGGILAYADICKNNWPEQWDSTQGVPYAYKGKQWVTYDNPTSVAVKIEFARTLNVTNVLVWSLETDDKEGDCTGTKYPVLTAINDYLKN